MKKLLYISAVLSIVLTGCSSQSENFSGNSASVKVESKSEVEQNYIKKNTKISKEVSTADYNIPYKLNDLEDSAELILTVRAIKDLGSDIINDEPLGSKKEVEVLNVHNQSDLLSEGDIITIYEPAYVEDNEYHAVEDYIKMEDENEYTLFLRKGDSENEFGIVSLGFGKYSEDEETYSGNLTDFSLLSETEPYNFASDHEDEIELYETIEEEVFEKYN